MSENNGIVPKTFLGILLLLSACATPSKPVDSEDSRKSPEPGRRDLDPLWRELAGVFGGDWTARKVSMGPPQLRKEFESVLGAQAVKNGMRDVLGNEVLLLQPKAAPASGVVAIAVMEGANATAARRLFDLDLELAREKDARARKGTPRLVRSDYADYALEGATRGVEVTMVMSVREQEVVVRSIFLESGRFVVELLYSNVAVADSDIADHAGRVCRFLAAK